MDFVPSFIRNLLSSKKSAGGVTAQWTVVGGVETAEQNLLQANKEWVFIAVDKIASSVASIRFKVMRYQRNGDDQEVFDGPLVDFLENPATDFTGKDFLYLNTVYKELTGNAFWEKDKGKKVKPLIATQVSPILQNGELVGYKHLDAKGQRAIPLKDMLHDRYVDPARPYWGVGKLAKIVRWVDTSSFANEFLRRFFINGAQFGGFIETEEESEERIKLIKVGLTNDHVGVHNAHKMGVLPKGAKYQQTTANMSDMEMGATDDRYRDKILSGFGVPKTLVGLTTEVNRASAEASEYVYAKYTIKPIADDLLEFLNTNVAPMFDQSGKYYFAYDEFVPVNMEIELKEREIALNRQPYKTVNEVRAEVGLPPVKDGDVIYGNPFQVPLGQPAPAPNSDPGADDDDDEEEPPEPKKGAPSHIRKAVVRERAFSTLLKGITDAIPQSTTSPDEVAHRSFVSRVDAHQEILARKVRDFNLRQRNSVIQSLKQTVNKDVAKGDLFDMNGEVSVLIDFVSPLLKGLLVEQAIEEYLAQGFEGQFDPAQSSIKTIVERAAKRLARSYNNTTATLLKSALNDGLQAGEDLTQLADRVNGVYDYSDRVRATATAQTEAFYIANEGSREAYRQSGVVTEVRWYTSEDERVCEFCGPEDGRIVSIKDNFYPKGHALVGSEGGTLLLDYRTMDVPPLHTNCRCFIRPETIEVS